MSIPKSCSAAIHRHGRAIHLGWFITPAKPALPPSLAVIAWFTQRVKTVIERNYHHFSDLTSEWSGQLKNLGLKVCLCDCGGKYASMASFKCLYQCNPTCTEDAIAVKPWLFHLEQR